MGAEVLKLRKRRGLVVTVGLLTVGASVLVWGILILLHALNAAKHGPAGGVTNLGHSLWLLGTLGSVAAILVGGTAGAGDLGANVFRELAVTGRSRIALYTARIPGGLAFLLTFVAVAYGIAAIASVTFAGFLAPPSAGLLVRDELWALLATSFWFLVALGFSSLVGSRTTPVAILLPFHLAVSQILVSLAFLGAAREAVPIAGLDRLLPHAMAGSAGSTNGSLEMSIAAAVLVLVAWGFAWAVLGAWRITTRDA